MKIGRCGLQTTLASLRTDALPPWASEPPASFRRFPTYAIDYAALSIPADTWLVHGSRCGRGAHVSHPRMPPCYHYHLHRGYPGPSGWEAGVFRRNLIPLCRRFLSAPRPGSARAKPRGQVHRPAVRPHHSSPSATDTKQHGAPFGEDFRVGCYCALPYYFPLHRL